MTLVSLFRRMWQREKLIEKKFSRFADVQGRFMDERFSCNFCVTCVCSVVIICNVYSSLSLERFVGPC